ncbi:hypothetical protein [Burkholderia sp. Cy-637]|uniref:hypothetical protein n=1 Tax=Burkholderia sp. Cy-637 TaxID=2608327 RepID=UPI001422C8E5|nr:hypothetical protein [Burkholderia sp. Cy-637]NIF89747.1 hypothetical protein [Burkholderia sp. Cy-637]
MRIQSILSAVLIATMLSTTLGAKAGIIEQNIRDAANGTLNKKSAPPARCSDPARPALSMMQNEGGGILNAGIGLASLAVLAASVSLLSSPKHDNTFRSNCDSDRLAKSSSGAYPFAAPSSAPAPTTTE